MNTFSFLITSLIIILIPGTGIIYTISTGLSQGRKASITASLGCTLGIVPHLAISILLSSLFLGLNSQLFNLVKFAGFLYLMYLGFNLIFSKLSLNFNQTKTAKNEQLIIGQAILINLLNPKLTLFFFAFLPQYISSNSRSYLQTSLFYGLAFMLLTFIVFSGYGLIAGAAQSFLSRTPILLQRLQQLFGVIFILFALQLAASTI